MAVTRSRSIHAMKQNSHGFTLIEIVVVLVLIGIISATVFGRSITTGQVNLAGEIAKLRNHIRYPQSLAMKRGETWGFACDASNYWIFTGTNRNTSSNQEVIPGEKSIMISLNDLGIGMENFTVFFDSFGRPFWGNPTTPIAVQESITVTYPGTTSRSITILGETGFIK